jgi:hypothetical protein
MNMNDIGRRFALVGGVATGVIAFVVSINAAFDSRYWESGVLLLAAAVAFGSVGYVFGNTKEQ